MSGEKKKPWQAVVGLPSVIEASAGTGKTYNLERLWLNLAMGGKGVDGKARAALDPEGIITVTFTNAAALELKERIGALIRSGLETKKDLGGEKDLDQEALDRLQVVRSRFESAIITTIHGFCQQILTQYGLWTRVGSRMDPGAGTALLRWQTARESLMANAQGLDAPRLEAVVNAVGNAKAQDPATGMVGLVGELLAESSRLKDLEKPPIWNADVSGAAEIWDSVTKAAEAAHRRLRLGKARAGTWDFDDMITLLRETVDNKDFATFMKGRFKAALIDEFQDTDPRQWGIFETLFLGKESGRTVALIGDPKQSIYRFRGGDLYTYRDAKEKVLKAPGGTREDLTENFRSSPLLIDALNGILSHALNPLSLGSGSTTGAPAFPKIEKPRPESDKPGILLTRNGKEEPPVTLAFLRGQKAPEIKASFLDFLTAEIGRLLSGAHMKRAKVETDGAILQRPVVASDIAVLVTANAQAMEVERCLKRAGIPAVRYLSDEETVFESEEGALIQAMLEAMDDIGDRSLTRLLFCPQWGIPLSDLSRNTTGAGRPQEILSTYRPVVNQWRQLVDRGQIGQWMEKVLHEKVIHLPDAESISLATSMARDPDTLDRRLTNLKQIEEILQRLHGEGHRGVGPLSRAWRETRATPAPGEAFQIRLDRDANAVKVLTVHKSKGLEWPIVFCMFLNFPPPKKKRLLIRGRKDPGTGKVFPQAQTFTALVGETDETEDPFAAFNEEEVFHDLVRNYYVGLTRPRTKLVLPFTAVMDGKTRRPYFQNHFWRRFMTDNPEVKDYALDLKELLKKEKIPQPTFAILETLARDRMKKHLGETWEKQVQFADGEVDSPKRNAFAAVVKEPGEASPDLKLARETCESVATVNTRPLAWSSYSALKKNQKHDDTPLTEDGNGMQGMRNDQDESNTLGYDGLDESSTAVNGGERSSTHPPASEDKTEEKKKGVLRGKELGTVVHNGIEALLKHHDTVDLKSLTVETMVTDPVVRPLLVRAIEQADPDLADPSHEVKMNEALATVAAMVHGALTAKMPKKGGGKFTLSECREFLTEINFIGWLPKDRELKIPSSKGGEVAYQPKHGFLHGFYDLLVRDPAGGLHLIDYKTDKLTGPLDKAVEEKMKDYTLQASLYAQALQKVLDNRGQNETIDGIHYLFLQRTQNPTHTLDLATLPKVHHGPLFAGEVEKAS